MCLSNLTYLELIFFLNIHTSMYEYYDSRAFILNHIYSLLFFVCV